MILSDTEILEAIDSKELGISPFDENMLQPASYDLKVGENAATVPENGEAIINLRDEGIVVINAYTPAVVWTLEQLTIPLNMAGRIGLKSNLSRRGVYASLGPQIDPGFSGNLSVSLFNLTPSPVVLNFQERFLTVELHKLGKTASRGYEGEYQNRKTFSAKELQPVLGFKGSHGLGEIVKGFGEIKKAVETISSLSSKFDSFLEENAKQNQESREFNRALMNEMRTLVGHIVGDRPQTIVLRAISKEEARREIIELFKNNKGKPIFYSDISEKLQLDLEMVVEICHELEQQGEIGLFGKYETE
jgi:dCTP deaminase